MSGELLYLDSSALVKLVLPEKETSALLSALEHWPERVTSEIALVEVVRAARRASDSAQVRERARQVMEAIHLIRLDRDLLDSATRLAPVTLRSLDSIHLASALALGSDLGAFAAYDRGLRHAARLAGVKVLAPAQHRRRQ